jgi:hypothetical protein
VKTPPNRGPTTDATAYTAPSIPVKAAACDGFALKAMIVYAPEAMPAPPAPAIARPTIKVVEFLATAHMRLPTSKIAMAVRKVV